MTKTVQNESHHFISVADLLEGLRPDGPGIPKIGIPLQVDLLQLVMTFTNATEEQSPLEPCHLDPVQGPTSNTFPDLDQVLEEEIPEVVIRVGVIRSTVDVASSRIWIRPTIPTRGEAHQIMIVDGRIAPNMVVKPVRSLRTTSRR
jgi:hypothetical protein